MSSLNGSFVFVFFTSLIWTTVSSPAPQSLWFIVHQAHIVQNVNFWARGFARRPDCLVGSKSYCTRAGTAVVFHALSKKMARSWKNSVWWGWETAGFAKLLWIVEMPCSLIREALLLIQHLLWSELISNICLPKKLMFPLNRSLLHKSWEETVRYTESLVGSSVMWRATGTLQASSEQQVFCCWFCGFLLVFIFFSPTQSVCQQRVKCQDTNCIVLELKWEDNRRKILL